MGTIGRDRNEYLYEMSFCDIYLIRRGFYRRNILSYQLQRLQAYGSFHCMSGSKQKPSEWMPLYFDKMKAANDDDDNDDLPEVDEDEVKALKEMLDETKKRWKQ